MTNPTRPPTDSPPAGYPRADGPRGSWGTSDYDRLIADVFSLVDRSGIRLVPREDAWVGGVCGGIGRRYGIDPVVIRVGVIVLTLFSGVGLVAYVLARLVLPAPVGPGILERAASASTGRIVTGIVLAAGGVLLLGGLVSAVVGGGFFASSSIGNVAVLALLLGGAYILARRRGLIPPAGGPAGSTGARQPATTHAHVGDGPLPSATADAAPATPAPAPAASAPTAAASAPTAAAAPAKPTAVQATASGGFVERPGTGATTAWQATLPPIAAARLARAQRRAETRPPRTRRRRLPAWVALILVGLSLLVTEGLVRLHDHQGWPGDARTVGLAGALALVAGVLLIAGLAGRRGGLSSLLAILLAVGVGASALASDPLWASGAGEPIVRVQPGSEPQPVQLASGRVTFDLTGLGSPEPSAAGPRHPAATMGVGDVVIRLPKSGSVRVTGAIGVGRVVVDGTPVKGLPVARITYDATFGSGPLVAVVDAHLRAGQLTILRSAS